MLGRAIYHFSRVESTNKIAFSLAEKGEREGTVILADEQFGGEGRRGRRWFSPLGGLWLSTILRPALPPEHTFIYPLMGAVAVAKAIKRLCSSCVYIHWPNDVMIRERKVGGAMCKIKREKEKVKFIILGVGVNLNIESFPPPLKELSTSLLLESHRPTYPFYFLDLFLNELRDLYSLSQVNQSLLMDKVQDFFPFVGKLVRVISSGEERKVWVKGIDYQGRLMVESENGIQQVITPAESVPITCL